MKSPASYPLFGFAPDGATEWCHGWSDTRPRRVERNPWRSLPMETASAAGSSTGSAALHPRHHSYAPPGNAVTDYFACILRFAHVALSLRERIATVWTDAISSDSSGFAILSRSERATSEVSRLLLRIRGKHANLEIRHGVALRGVHTAICLSFPASLHQVVRLRKVKSCDGSLWVAVRLNLNRAEIINFLLRVLCALRG